MAANRRADEGLSTEIPRQKWILRDRHEAGSLLAERLSGYRDQKPIVLALPRGVLWWATRLPGRWVHPRRRRRAQAWSTVAAGAGRWGHRAKGCACTSKAYHVARISRMKSSR